MFIPQGMTEQEVMDHIKTVVDRIAPKYTFYGYPIEDIKQESYIICMQALNRYDTSRPLENFLAVNLSNRLKTFVRDNFYTCAASENRKKVAMPTQLEYEDTLIDECNKFSISYDDIDRTEMSHIIDSNIPAAMRMDYLKMMNDIYIPRARREEIMEFIKETLTEKGFYDEEG